MSVKPREHYNWNDFTDEEKAENYRWFCSCEYGVCENYNYCPWCGAKLYWGGVQGE